MLLLCDGAKIRNSSGTQHAHAQHARAVHAQDIINDIY